MTSARCGTAPTYETLLWEAPADAGYGLADLWAAQRQAGNYAAAIPASIAELAVSLPAAVLADAEEASNEITRFDAERVPGAIEDLLAFTRRPDVPSLPQIAIAHAQFETIHPFTDGNGRTGRALIQAMLRHKRLTRQITVPVSAGLLSDTDAYFGALGSYRDGDPAPMVERLSEASLLAVANGRRLVSDLRSIRDEWDSRIAARRDSAVHRVADLLIGHPVFNAQLLQRELGIRTGNARRYVDPLTAAEIIVEFTDRARNRAWRAPEVLSALDAFAARAGRRSRSD